MNGLMNSLGLDLRAGICKYSCVFECLSYNGSLARLVSAIYIRNSKVCCTNPGAAASCGVLFSSSLCKWHKFVPLAPMVMPYQYPDCKSLITM